MDINEHENQIYVNVQGRKDSIVFGVEMELRDLCTFGVSSGITYASMSKQSLCNFVEIQKLGV